MYVGNVGAAFAAFLASKRQPVSRTMEPEAVEAEAVVMVEMTADAGLTEARTKLAARDAQAGLAAQALNIANSEKHTEITALVR